MNYLKELNAFYDWLELNELSASAINLWYALMHINNKAGWVETFTVAESVLSVKTGLSGRTIRTARNELKQKGRIDFKSRKGGKAPTYTIISFETGINVMEKSTEKTTENNTVEEISSEINAEDTSGGNAGDTSGGNAEGHATLYKLNKTKLKDVVVEEESPTKIVAKLFEQSGMGTINSTIAQMIMEISKNHPLDLIEEAFKRAKLNHASSIRYVEKILISWKDKSINSIEQLKIYETNKSNKNNKTGGGSHGDNRSNSQEDNPYAGVKKLKLGKR